MEKIINQSRLVKSKVMQSVSDRDVLIIWDALAYYIREEMSKKRGVVVPGFGTFTFVEHRLDIGNKKELLKLKPFFLQSNKFAQFHAVDFEKDYVNVAIPVSRVNYAALSELTRGRFSRQVVENVLGEAFTAIDHFLRLDGKIMVPFNGLGCLSIDCFRSTKTKPESFFKFSTAMIDRVPYLC